MDDLIQRFANTGRFSEPGGERGVFRDRVRYTVHANRILLRATLGDSGAIPLVTVPLGETWVATSFRIHNTSETNDRIVTLRDVPYGGVNALAYQWGRITLRPNETLYLYGIEEVWDGGYSIFGWADVAEEVLLKVQGTPLVDA